MRIRITKQKILPGLTAAMFLLASLSCGGDTTSTQVENSPSPSYSGPPPTSTTAPTRTPLPPTATTTPLPIPGQIVFLSNRDGNPEIYSMHADGSQQTRLTNTDAYEIGPVGSPDGTFIAFSANYTGDQEIYRMQTDGSGLTQLTTSPGMDAVSAWSPDSNWLLFSSQRNQIEGFEGPPSEIYIMDRNGDGQRRLTRNTSSDYCASWSPDMSQISFSSYRFDFDFVRIAVMDLNRADSRFLVDLPENAFCPVWSPDGQWIVFYTADLAHGWGDMWLMSPDGTNQQRLHLFDGQAKFDGVRWSPDGQWLVFAADGGSGWDVYVASPDGQELVNLTAASPVHDRSLSSPSWIP